MKQTEQAKHAKKENKTEKKRQKLSKRARKLRQQSPKKHRRKRQLKVLLVLLVIAIAGAGITIYRDYQARPGFLEKVWIADRGADYVTIAWEKPRNVYRYVITYNGGTINVSGRNKQARIEGLSQDTYYIFTVRADSREREGFEALTASARTKKQPRIIGDAEQMRFANRPVNLGQTAETPITYTAADGSINVDGDMITFTRPGKTTVKATTQETEEYASVSKDITVNVLDSVNVASSGASPHILYKLNKNNCECVKTIRGPGKTEYPQALAYDSGQYIVSFINATSDEQRIVTYGDRQSTVEPLTDLGHANGLTLADGYYYSVRGGGSKTCITFDKAHENYGTFELPYYASGIAYDPVTDMFYASSRNNLIAYDGQFNIVNKIKLISRKYTYYVQDCGAYGGILLHGVSGPEPQKTNYIDFYDILSGMYLGSAECDLNEIESIIVDDEGYIEILCNAKGRDDYIWKTPINMKKLCS